MPQTRPSEFPHPLLEHARQFRLSGHLNAAAKCYNQLIDVLPQNIQAHYGLAEVRQQQGQFDPALASFLNVIRLDPNDISAYRRLWWLDAEPAQLEEAVQVCSQSIYLESCKVPAVVYATLGNLLTRLGRIAAALEAFQNSARALTAQTYPTLVERHWLTAKSHGPDFLVIGGMKCGTTSIYRYLCQHPCLLPAIEKEIHFFSLYPNTGIDWYLSQFPRIPAQHFYKTGEASPYLGTAGVPERVFRHFPNVKLVVLLRNPVDRAYSHYQHSVRYFGVTQSFEEIISPELTSPASQALLQGDEAAYNSIQSAYLSFSLYAYSLKAWLKLFPREQFLFLRSENLFTQPSATMANTFDFLGLPDFPLAAYPNTLEGRYPDLSPTMRERLMTYFQPHNQRLEDLLGWSFQWEV